MAVSRSGSMLAADFGNVTTRVMLIDIVDGQYHVVAVGQSRTTSGYPLDDVNVGLHRVLNEISAVTGRDFISMEGEVITPEQPDRSGVDYFIATASAGPPMKTVIAGLMPNVSLASALHAVSTSYVKTVGMFHLEDDQSEEDHLNTIMLNNPDLVLIVGGTDSGAEEAVINTASVVQMAVGTMDPMLRPVVLYAGNSQLRDKMEAMFADLTSFLSADNVRPSIANDQLESIHYQLGRAFHEFNEQNGGGLALVGEMSKTGLMPTSQSYSLITEYLAKTHKKNIIVADIGSAVSTITMSIEGKSHTVIRTDMGLGHSAPALLETLDYEEIEQWLPFYTRKANIINYVMNKRLRPASIPLDLNELYIEHALLRAIGRHLIGELRSRLPKAVSRSNPDIGMIIGAGGALTGTGHSAYNMLLLLDIFQPTGITEIKADSIGLIPALGAIAALNPEAVVQLLEGDDLEHLGTVVSVSGKPKLDQPAIELRVITEDGEVFEESVKGGHMLVLPISAQHELEIEMTAARGLSLGRKKKYKLKLRGGTAGIVFDARGRPLPVGETPADRAAQFPMWISEMTDREPIQIDERWLRVPSSTAAKSDRVEEVIEETKPKKRGLFSGLFGRREKRERPERPGLPDITEFDLPEDDDMPDLLDDDERDETLDDGLGDLRDVLS